jgi:hypothetical protein
MKKLVLTLTATWLLAGTVSAQKFYIRAGGGYAMPLAGQSMNTSNNAPFNGKQSYNAATDITSFEAKPASFGAGGNAMLGAGYMFTDNIGVELNIFAGVAPKKYSSVNSYTDPSSGELESFEYLTYARMPVLVSPALKIQSSGDFSVYSRFGALLPVKNGFNEETSGTFNDGSSTSHIEAVREFQTKFGLGFNGAAGVSVKTNSWLRIWGELNFNAMSVQVTEGTYTEAFQDGENILPYLEPDEITVEFATEGTDATALPSFMLPFSSIGIMAGISIGL